MNQDTQAHVPDALLLIATGCPHCPVVLEGMTQLVKEGRIGRLEVINVTASPERAQLLEVRTVPWLQIGPFVLEGLHSKKELQRWAERTGSPTGMADYFEELLAAGGLGKVLDMVKRDKTYLRSLLVLLEKPDTDINVRLGVSAAMEAQQGSAALKSVIDELGRLTRSDEPRLRGDACFFLSLTGSAEAKPFIEPLLNDENKDVREIAKEAMADLAKPASIAARKA